VLGVLVIVSTLGGLTILGFATAIAFDWPMGE
jgi:hypothetical protein